jgi:hypothetical protein
MNGTSKILLIATALLAALLQVGCGGSSPQTAASASIRFTIKWPARTARLIPVDCQSIVAVVDSSGGTQVATQTIPRPSSGTSTTVNFTGLKPGNDTLTATAYPTETGSGVAQATSSAPATVLAGQTAQITVTMADTIVKVVITPADPVIFGNNYDPLVMTAYDSENEIVLTSSTTTSWQSSNTAVATILSNGNVRGVNTGTSLITATETESGISGTTTATVNPIQPVNVVVDRSGKYAYAVNQNGSLYEFSVGSNGQLTPLSPSYITTGYNSSGFNGASDGYSAYVAPNNTLYVVEQTNPLSGYANGNNVICQYSIQSNGQLQTLAPAIVLQTDAAIYNLFADPSGSYLYLDMQAFQVVAPMYYFQQYTFQIGPAGLTQVGSPAATPAFQVAAPIFGTSYIVGVNNSGFLTTCQTQTDGSLTIVFNGTYTTTRTLFASPSGAFVYATPSSDGLLHCFSVNPNGSLTDNGVAGSLNWTSPTFVENSTGTVMVESENGSISSYTVNTNGMFTLVSSISGGYGSYLPIEISPNNAYVYSPSTVFLDEYSLTSSGVLTFVGTVN